MRVAELFFGALAAAAAGGSASTTPASGLQHHHQLLQQCSSLVAALASFVGAPVILDRLLTALDALPLEDQQTQAHELHELVLFERIAELKAALELAHVVHEFLDMCASCTCIFILRIDQQIQIHNQHACDKYDRVIFDSVMT